jgi:hypothetical protein
MTATLTAALGLEHGRPTDDVGVALDGPAEVLR